MQPLWYYTVGAIQGLVSWIAIALSALSDVMPKQWRAPAFGMLLAGFSFGFALAPQLAILLGHFRVTVMSLTMLLSGFLVVLCFFPETLSPEESQRARLIRQEQYHEIINHNTHNNTDEESSTSTIHTTTTTIQKQLLWMVYRPLWELTILNRNQLFRLLSALAFFSGIVSAGDRTLLLYYLEERLAFNDQDVATMFLIMGVLGIFVQAFVLKFLNDRIGERYVVMLSFLLGTLHNTLYGFAQDKQTVFVAVAIGSFVSMAFPTISAIKANAAAKSEQGRIQGALYSLSALASAVGPLTLRLVYHYTKDGFLAGPGTMFLFAGVLYAVASYCAYLLPVSVHDTLYIYIFTLI
jgi:DHA1 family tetracycline resistance protein-like MFS transporter